MNDVKHLNYYGLDHEEVNNRFDGDLIYLGDVVFVDEYEPWALYRSSNPNRDLGHNEFFMLSVSKNGGYVRGKEESDFKIKERYKNVAHCLSCGDKVYSCMRHDFHPCSCGKIAIDGGIDYLKISAAPDVKYEILTLDILTGKVYTDEEMEALDE